MWTGDVEKGKWMLDMCLVGDKEVLEKISTDVVKDVTVTVHEVRLAMGTGEGLKGKEYAKLAEEDD